MRKPTSRICGIVELYRVLKTRAASIITAIRTRAVEEPPEVRDAGGISGNDLAADNGRPGRETAKLFEALPGSEEAPAETKASNR